MNTLRHGFSLVEIAVVLIILGVITAVGINMGSGMVDTQQRVATEQKTKMIDRALRAYFDLNGRMPCPAPATTAKGAAGFGIEDCGISAVDEVLIGAVPVSTLGIADAMIADEYGNRFTYAVDEEMVDPATVETAQGSIQVQDASGDAISTEAIYFLTSHGADGKGAVNNETAVRDTNCTGTANDVQNCTNSNAIFVQTRKTSGTVEDNFFDDTVQWGAKETLVKNTGSGITNDAACGEGTGDIVRVTATGVAQRCDGTGWVNVNPCDGNNANAVFFDEANQRVESCSGDGSANTSYANCPDEMPKTWTVGSKTCTQNLGGSVHGRTVSLEDTDEPIVGTVSYKCENGTWNKQSPTCVENCTTKTEGWTVAGKSCSASIAAAAHGANSSGTDGIAPVTGAATFSCDNGNWVEQAGSTCVESCPTQTLSWTVSGKTCTASVSGAGHGANSSGTDSGAPTTGSATYSCNNGTWVEQAGSTCVESCPAGSKTWTVAGKSCTASVAGASHGASSTGTDSGAPTTGSATYSCNNGVWSGATSASCIQSCTLPWGGSIAHGASVTAYSTNTPSGATCASVSETRTCTNGTLSGSFTNQSCSAGCASSAQSWTVSGKICNGTPAAAASGQTKPATDSGAPTTGSRNYVCTNGSWSGSGGGTCVESCTRPWGGALANGASVTAYQTSSVPYGSTCTSQTRTCSNGSLSGSYTNASCTVDSASNCTLDGVTVTHGNSRTFYSTNSVPFGGNCNTVDQVRTCTNGTLSGSASFNRANCTVASASNCTTPWGATVPHGGTWRVWDNASENPGGCGPGVLQTCNNGSATPSTSYQEQSCNEGCNKPWGGAYIPHGGSVTAYQTSSVTCGNSCNSQTRSCNNGSLSGSYTNASCSVGACCSPVNGGWSGWSWSGWGSCSNSCGTGTQTRTGTRSCNSPSPSCGGSSCGGSSTTSQSQSCTDYSGCGDGGGS